jgi:hypothetical protein
MTTTPILTNVESTMVTLIEGMTIAGGYHYDWATCNQPDMALQEFPNALVELEPTENCLDEPLGADALSYIQEVSFKITARVKVPTEASVPNWAINNYLNEALDDLKRCFGRRDNLQIITDTGAFIILYRSSQRIIERAGDRFIPCKLETSWTVRYTQSREEPSQPGDV